MPQEEAIWESLWHVVREELIGLKEIRVWILADGFVTGEGDEARMLAPLREVRGVEVKFLWQGADRRKVGSR